MSISDDFMLNLGYLQAFRTLSDDCKMIWMLDTSREVDAHLARREAEAMEDALQCSMDALAEFRRRDNLRGQEATLKSL